MNIEIRYCSVCSNEFESENGLVSCSRHSFGEVDPMYETRLATDSNNHKKTTGDLAALTSDIT